MASFATHVPASATINNITRYLYPYILRLDGTLGTMAEEGEIYDEIEIEDMVFDQMLQIYHYPCPCGDRFEINIDDLRDGHEIAVCPSCSLQIRVIFDISDLPEKKEDKPQPIPITA